MRRHNYGSLEFRLARPLSESRRIRISRIPISRGLNYATALYNDDSATLDDLLEAVTTLEETERMARRVFGGTHPLTTQMEQALREVREGLGTREAPPRES